jgi:hypothetical protein
MDVDEFTFDGTAGQVVDLVGLQAPTTSEVGKTRKLF